MPLRTHIALGLVILSCDLVAQPRITSVRTLAAGDHRWGYAQFSPDGASIVHTTLSYDGIWVLDIATGAQRRLTSDAGSGYNFALSPDGKTIAFRRTVQGKTWRERKQEVVTMNVASGSTQVLGAARSLSTPTFDGNSPAFIQAGAVFNPAPSKNRVTVLGIESGKIQLLVNGQRKALDPLGNGNYIWPSLSPDKRSFVAYEMDRGAFISDLSGKVLAKLGGLDGPTWSRDGGWVIAFDELNDGHTVTGSDLFAVKPDGTGKVQLTTTADVIELYPSCSPTENKIVCHTLDGKLLLISYEVRP